MKTLLFILLSIISVSFGISQNQPKLDSYPFKDLEVNIVIFSFGMEKPIKIGTIMKSGEINFEFPTELPKSFKEDTDSFMQDIAYTVFDVCDNAKKIISEHENPASFEVGGISLSTNDNPYAGIIYAVSDKALMPWVDDPNYEEPTLASYFELVYVASAFQFEGDCIQTQSSMSEDPDMEIAYSFNLNLKTGFNFIEYKIESIHKTDPKVMASFPDKVSITSVDGVPNSIWVGKYF